VDATLATGRIYREEYGRVVASLVRRFADLLRRLGRSAEARAAYDAAISSTENEAERAYLSRRRGSPAR
jgi:predicted RNA polymerase sigma factor